MYHAPRLTLDQFDDKTSEAVTRAFTQDRIESVNHILENAPYVYLTGLTGVGKTTFVSQELFKEENTTLYQGEEKLFDWATDTSDKRKILFIDEANITSREWSEFEGLYHTPPGILINGEYITLSDNHKVIFAGNPLSYGGERRLAPLFKKHGNALLFKPMPLGFIYEKILRPVFKQVEHEQSLEACQVFLNVYQFLCEHSENKVLITPRELQMMAIMTAALCAQNKSIHLKTAAEHYAYVLAKDLVPFVQQDAFDVRFKPKAPINRPDKEEAETEETFLITESRESLSNHLSDLLKTRLYKSNASDDEIKYGGLGGIVIEGEPGIGKSELVTHALTKAGYEEAHWPNSHRTNKPFYRMPVSMQLDDKKALLLRAFDEGDVVVIDEINSSPMMERLLNDLLMGRTPEGNRPTTPGFMIIGTQNPASLGGRQKATTALAHRLTTIALPSYTRDEIRRIVMQKGITQPDAEELISAYEEQRAFARANHLKPVPSFRDVLKLADRIIEGIVRSDTANKNELAEESVSFTGNPSSFFRPASPAPNKSIDTPPATPSSSHGKGESSE